MNLAIVQLAPRSGSPEANREQAVEAIGRAAKAGADLVVLPELFTVGYFAFDAYAAAAEPLHGPTVERLGAVAREHDVGVLAGSFIEDLTRTVAAETPAETGLANTSVLLDAEGTIAATYRKWHLFGYESEESSRLVAGRTLGTATFAGWPIGIATCYDLRFPELFRRYVEEGVELLLVPSAWPSDRPGHWTTLARARAIENQWYLAAANGAGTISDTELLGRSAVYDPWGETVVDLDRTPDVALVELDRARVDAIRTEFPVLADRRLDGT